MKVQEEERLKAELAKLAAEQDIQVRAEALQREVEVAEQVRLRAVGIEEEDVIKARELAIVSREREVELQRIDKDKALEEEKKVISNVRRERIAVEKTVAVEEENIKEVREVSKADREKQALVIAAQARAEEELVRQVKQAEADEQSAKHRSTEINILAQAELERAEKESEAKKRLAEGVEAENAALGLAEAKVRQANAEAEEKEGLVKARIDTELLLAKAKGEKEVGLSEASIIEAKAAAIKEQGIAEAFVIAEKLKAEAEGLVQKFQAMSSMSAQAREHEEYRMALEKGLEQAMASIAANKEIAAEQAEVLAAAFSKANLQIVGGNDNFFNSFSKAISVGKAVEGAVGESPLLKSALDRVLNRFTQIPVASSKESEKPAFDLQALASQFLGQQSQVNTDNNIDKNV